MFQAKILSSLLAAALTLIWAFTAAPLAAQWSDESQNASEAEYFYEEGGEGFGASVSIGVGISPTFEGSKDYETNPLPIFNLRYGNFFLSSSRGLGYTIIRTPHWTVAPAVTYIFGRDESDSPILAGMGDVNGGPAAGGRVGFHQGPFSILMDLYLGLGALQGSTIDLGAYYSPALGGPLTATFGIGSQYATAERNQARFGVTPIQSLNSGYPVYTPGPGVKHLAFSGSLKYQITQMFDVGVFGEYRVLTGPAEDSPLVRAGSENQVRAGLSLGFHLN